MPGSASAVSHERNLYCETGSTHACVASFQPSPASVTTTGQANSPTAPSFGGVTRSLPAKPSAPFSRATAPPKSQPPDAGTASDTDRTSFASAPSNVTVTGRSNGARRCPATAARISRCHGCGFTDIAKARRICVRLFALNVPARRAASIVSRVRSTYGGVIRAPSR